MFWLALIVLHFLFHGEKMNNLKLKISSRACLEDGVTNLYVKNKLQMKYVTIACCYDRKVIAVSWNTKFKCDWMFSKY